MSRFIPARMAAVIARLGATRGYTHSPVVRYGIAVSYWLAVTALILSSHLTFEQSALLLVWPAVILTTWLGGFAVGLVASAAALITLSYLVSFPYHVIHTDPEFFIAVGAFFASVCLVAMIRARQRRVETALRLSQQQTLAILETLSDPFYGLDQNWRITYANAPTERLWGRPREALIGRSIWDEFPKSIGGLTYTEMHDAVREQRARRFETYSDSLGCWVEINLYPNPQGLSVYLRDITDRMHAQERTATLQQVTACFSQAITINQIAEVIVREGAHALGGHVGTVALLTEDRQALDLVSEYNAAGEPAEAGRRIPLDSPCPLTEAARTGQPVWAESPSESLTRDPHAGDHLFESGGRASAALPLTVNGRVIGTFGIGFASPRSLSPADRDLLLTLAQQCAQALERARLYETELKARREAEEANRLKMQFLGMISHELRTPLASIKGFATTLLAKDVRFSPAEQDEFLGIIDGEADKLTELIDQLLDLSRLQSGNLRMKPVPQRLHAVLGVARAQLSTLACHHVLVVNVPDTLPAVKADPQRIAQVFTNLVGNATKFAPPGTPITITAREREQEVEVTVSDQGPGIPAEAREYVFEPFRQIERRGQRPMRGAGLGLAICKGIIQAHGGRIWVPAQPLKGAVIAFNLPVVTAHDSRATPGTETAILRV